MKSKLSGVASSDPPLANASSKGLPGEKGIGSLGCREESSGILLNVRSR